MAFPVITSALTDQIASALCNTLVHSLWQGLLLSAAGGLIIVSTKKASSALRYNLLIAALVLFTVGVGVTFAMQFQQTQPVNVGQVFHPATANAATTATVIHTKAADASTTETVFAYLNQYHNTIVLIWFLIICAKSVQFGAGLFGTYQLKRSNVIAVAGYWNERVKQLAALMGVEPAIRLLESGIAKVPMVIGHLKPVVLIPIGLLTALSEEEVEAILVHELAHIKRRDYLVNLLQSLVEIVFFFNPAVLWISQLIKTERENCCDDMALAQSSNKVSYIRALVSCEEYQSVMPAYAMSFAGSKNTLLNRVKRMAGSGNHSLNIYEKTALAICLVTSGLCMSAFAARENIKHVVNTVETVFHHTELNKTEQQKLVAQTTLVKQQTIKLTQTLPIVTNSINKVTITDTNKIKPAKPVIPANVNVVPAAPALSKPTPPLAPMVAMAPVKVTLSPMNVTIGALNVPLSISVTDTTRRKIKAEVKAMVNDSVNVQTNTSVNSNVNINYTYSTGGNGKAYSSATYSSGNGASSGKSYSTSSSPASASGSSSGKNYSNYSITYSPASKTYKTDSNKTYSKTKFHPAPTTVDAGEELFKAKLITDKNNFTMKLTNDELIINGVKQSEANHQLILKKFQKKAGDKVNMVIKVNSKTDAFAAPANFYTLFIPQHC